MEVDQAIARMGVIEARVQRAYDALEKAIKSETLNFSRWTYFTVGVLAGSIGGPVVYLLLGFLVGFR